MLVATPRIQLDVLDWLRQTRSGFYLHTAPISRVDMLYALQDELETLIGQSGIHALWHQPFWFGVFARNVILFKRQNIWVLHHKCGMMNHAELHVWEIRIARSYLAIQLVFGLHWAALTIVQSLFVPLSNDLHFTTTQLGLLSTARTFTMFLSLPIFGWLGDHISRRHLLAAGLVTWATFNACHVFVSSYTGYVVCSSLTGLGLGVVTPCARSLISHYYPLERRGLKFGQLEVSAGIGGFTGVMLGTLLYPHSTSILKGYQLALLMLSILTLPAVYVVERFVLDPLHDRAIDELLAKAPYHSSESESAIMTLSPVPSSSQLAATEVWSRKSTVFAGIEGSHSAARWSDIALIARTRMFICIVMQGLTGAIPWTALAFLIPWFERMHIPNFLAALIFLAISGENETREIVDFVAGGAAFGGAIGGFLGDYFYRTRSQRYGRIAVAQTSVFIGIFGIIGLLSIPHQPSYWPAFLIGGMFLGALIAWPP